MSEDRPGTRRRSLSPGLALALGWFVLFALILAALLYVALFGRAEDASPRSQLALAAQPAHGAQPVQAARQGKAAANAAPAPQPQMGQEQMGQEQAGQEQAGQAQMPQPQPGQPQMSQPQPGQPQMPQPQPPSASAASASAAGEPALPPKRVPARIAAPVYAGKALIADPALIEQTPQGPLPRIAAGGRKPMNAYAPPVPPHALKGKKPIALVIAGLGISARATRAALDGLPAGVTLAFAPYAGDVQRWVSEARARGHEVLLEVPMEPYDFPDSDPGPHTLRPMLGKRDNLERLKWSLTRFTGYAGVTNLLGGRFLASAHAAAPVMRYIAGRGLMFFDSGTTARSAAESIAEQIKAPYVQSGVEIDSIQSGMEIDQRLAELEAQARSNGSAAGTGFLYPVTVARVAAWAQGLGGRGFVLVPASSIVGADH